MFGRKNRQIKELETIIHNMSNASESLRNRPFIIDIVKEGQRMNFIIAVKGEVHKIETFATLSCNVNQLKETLGISI